MFTRLQIFRDLTFIQIHLPIENILLWTSSRETISSRIQKIIDPTMGFLQSFTLYCGSVLLVFLGLYCPQRYRSLFIVPTWTLLVFSIGYLRDVKIPGISFQLGMLCIITILQAPIIFRRHTASRWTWKAAYKSYNNPRMLLPEHVDRRAEAWSWTTRIVRPMALYAAKLLLYAILARFQCTWDDFSPSQESLIRRALRGHVTIRDLLVRTIITVVWFLDTATQLEIAHCILSLVFVALFRLDNIREWPPLFGSPSEAYTIRRFWTRFWHQLFSPSAAIWARAIVDRVPGLESIWLGKVFVALCVFSMSGGAHALIAWQLGDGHGYRDMSFFLINFSAVIVEILVSKLSGYKADVHKQNPSKPGIGRRICGILWVCGFLIWLTPKVAYPRVYTELSSRFWTL